MIDHLSVSSANLWDQCPLQWHAKYVLGVKDEPGPAAVFGTVVHSALETLGQLDHDARTGLVIRASVESACASEPSVDPAHVTGHVERALTSMPASAATCEMELRCDVGGVPFLGYIDRVAYDESGSATICDYKSGARPARSAWMAEKFGQVETYAAALEDSADVEVTGGQLVWTATGQVDEWQIMDGAKNLARAWLRRVWEDIGDADAFGFWPAEPGPLCSWCPAADGCAEGTEAIRIRLGAGKSVGPHAAHAKVRD